MDGIVGKTYQTYNSLPPCQEIDISCHKLSQNGDFVSKYPSSVVVTIIATLRWASCGPGTGLQAHPLKSQNRFGKKKFADQLHKSYKKHPWQTSPTFFGHFTLQAESKINWNNYISMVLWACFSNKVCIHQKTNHQNGGCYDHGNHEITLVGSHSLHWDRVQWKIPCLRAKRFS